MFYIYLRHMSVLIAGILLATGCVTGPVFPQDLWMMDTPTDTGAEPVPNLPAAAPMWVSEDIWVRTQPDPGYRPQPFDMTTSTWIPEPHQNPEYRDPKYSLPNYVYVRVRNLGTEPFTGTTARLKLYWTKASSSITWQNPNQWVDYVPPMQNILYGGEITKERRNAATVSSPVRDAFVQAVRDTASPAFSFPDGVSYWHKQNLIHRWVLDPGAAQQLGLPVPLAEKAAHGTEAFFPWHREMLRRYELLLQEADPTVTLLYWDWSTNPAPAAGGGFNFFTNTFMGAGRTGNAPIGAPFEPSLRVTPNAAIRRNQSGSLPPGDNAGDTVSPQPLLSSNTYPGTQGLRSKTEGPRHNRSHGYIGGNTGNPGTGAEDPFFFLIHTNADRLWAEWQRNYTALPGTTAPNLSRLEPATAYGTAAGDLTITTTMAPYDGLNGLQPWSSMGSFSVGKTAISESVVFPPIYDTAPLRIPRLEKNEAVVFEIPWYPPNPADFASFGADMGHFCLLARIETTASDPWGMTNPEGADVYTNTKNNNNIVWKNITVVDDFSGRDGVTAFLVRNSTDSPSETELRFTQVLGFDPSFFDFGQVSVNLGPELFERWRASGARGRGIDLIGNTRIGVFAPDASIEGIKLEPHEMFPVEVHFDLLQDYPPYPGARPKLDVIQVGTEGDPDAVVGGVRFEVDFSELRLAGRGSEWRYFDGPPTFKDEWISVDFDDADWKSGRGDFGMGVDTETTIDTGPAGIRRITSYYRHTFEVDDPSFYRNLYVRVKRSAGVVVYLNGTEVHRDNLGSGPVTPLTPATREVTGLEREVYSTVAIDPGLLRRGRNVVAMEVHLASAKGDESSFDLEVTANVTDTRIPPDVTIRAPYYGQMIEEGEPVPLQAEALDGDGMVERVVFYEGDRVLNIDRTPPYTFNWTGLPLGAHQVLAQAVDSDELTTTSSTVFSVVENTPPTVALVQPGNGSTFRAGEAISLRADAYDYRGGIKRVDFYLTPMNVFSAPELVASSESAPFEASLPGLEPGPYMISAIAVDDRDLESQAPPSHIHVEH